MRLMSLLPRFALLIVCLFLANVTGKMQGEEFDTSLSVMQSGIHWSPDNRFIAVGTYNGIFIHDGATLKVVDYIASGYSVSAIAWHPNGKYIAFGTYEREGEVLILNADYTLWKQLPTHGDWVTDLRWSPNGEYLASKSNTDLSIWHLPSQQQTTFIELVFDRGYPSFALTWDQNSQFVTTHLGRKITIWDIKTGSAISSFGSVRESEIIEWSPNNQFIAVGKGWGDLVFYSTDDFELLETFEPKPGYYDLVAMDWNNDGDYFATHGWGADAHEASSVRIWRTKDYQLMRELVVGDVSSIIYYHSLAWSPDGTRLACAADAGKIFVWETENFSQLAVYDGYPLGYLIDEK